MLSGFLHKAAEVQPGWFPAERWPRRARKTHELIIVNSLFQSASNYVNLRKKEEDDKMEELLGWIEFIEETADSRQQAAEQGTASAKGHDSYSIVCNAGECR